MEITKTSLILGALFLVLGYFVGNVLPISGNSPQPAIVAQQGGNAAATAENQPQQAPNSIQLSPDDDPVVGDPNAPVQVYEFSDFQCPFCRKFFTESLMQLEKEYVDTGKVLFVYKDFPLTQIHPGAVPAALYSECAREQGKWRQMHDTIFVEQSKLGAGTVNFGQTELDQWARTAGLDMSSLNNCVSSNKYVQEVQDDLQKGASMGVTGTPSFFIGNKERGFVQLTGAQPYAVLKQVIDQYLQ